MQEAIAGSKSIRLVARRQALEAQARRLQTRAEVERRHSAPGVGFL